MSIREARQAFYGAKTPERRLAVRPIEVREAENGGLSFSGYASTTGNGYTVTDWLGDYTEVIERGAFGKSLSERDDVRLLVNHDGVPLARTKSGTLSLREVTDPANDPLESGFTGLWGEASLDAASPLVQTVRSAMARGDLDQMSFAFRATQQSWDEDYTMRTIREVQLFDVSVVTYPANPATSAGLRSGDKWLSLLQRAREGRALDAEDVNMLTQALAWLSAIDNIVDEGQEALAAYLKVPNPDADDMQANAADGAEDFAAWLRLQADAARCRVA